MLLIASTTLGSAASSVTFSNLGGQFSSYEIHFHAKSDTTNEDATIQINGTSSTINEPFENGTTTSTGTLLTKTVDRSATSSQRFSMARLVIVDRAGSPRKKVFFWGGASSSTTTTNLLAHGVRTIANSSAIDTITIGAASGNFVANSNFKLYAWPK